MPCWLHIQVAAAALVLLSLQQPLGAVAQQSGNATEAAALLAFRAALANSTALADWGTGGVCSWSGVACSVAGQVIKLWVSARSPYLCIFAPINGLCSACHAVALLWP